MNDLKAVSAMVKSILAEDTQARNDDNVLYLEVLQIVSNRNSIDLQSMTVPVFLLKMKEYGVKKSREQARLLGKDKIERTVQYVYRTLADVKCGNLVGATAFNLVISHLFFA